MHACSIKLTNVLNTGVLCRTGSQLEPFLFHKIKDIDDLCHNGHKGGLDTKDI